MGVLNGSNFASTNGLPPAPDALDRAIEISLRRSFEIPPVAPLPVPLPADPVTPAGTGLLAALGQAASELTVRQVAGLLLAAGLWATGGTLIYNALTPTPRYIGSHGQTSSAALPRTIAGDVITMRRIYQDLLDRPPTVSGVTMTQEERWQEVQTVLADWPESPVTFTLESAARPRSAVEQRVQLIRVHESHLLSSGALLISARVDGAFSVAVIAPGNHPLLHEINHQDASFAQSGVRYFGIRSDDVTAYELTTGGEARLIPALLNLPATRLERQP